MNTNYLFDLSSYLKNTNISEEFYPLINVGFGLLVLILFAYTAHIIIKKFVLRALQSVAKRTKSMWDDILLEKKVFNRLAHLVPAIIIYSAIGYILKDYDKALLLGYAVLKIYMNLMVILALDAMVSAMHHIYLSMDVAKDRPNIKGYVQIAKIIIYFIGVILILSIILNKKPTALFAGLGAMAAILLLVFKDTILGLVASIQLSANDMVRIGDYITMPSRNADGNVIEVTLNTVKVRNADKTISTIPTYALVSESFSNWRGMVESGGRRIKRHIAIDMKSVKFCTPEMLNKFSRINLLEDYIQNKTKEIAEYNAENKVDESLVVNGRRMTNLGTFRYYLEAYLKNNPMIHQDMPLLVRQLQPTETGIPIEIYVFCKVTEWDSYERIQADIFDHILSIIPTFELNVFQNPSGHDFEAFMKK